MSEGVRISCNGMVDALILLMAFLAPFKFHTNYVVMKECSVMLRTFISRVMCAQEFSYIRQSDRSAVTVTIGVTKTSPDKAIVYLILKLKRYFSKQSFIHMQAPYMV